MGCDIHMITEIRKNGKWERVLEIPETLKSRNYSVFAFLADVRNSWDINGFKPKGLPEDISGLTFDKDEDEDEEDYYNIDFREENSDYHSHSWLTLKELQDADKSDFLYTKIKVDKEFIDKFFEFGGKMPEQMEIIDYTRNTLVDMVYYAYQPNVIIRWKSVKESELKNISIFEGIKELEEIAEKYDVDNENIRIVFAFDN